MMEAGKTAAPFAWEDGPLIKAMRDGDILLVDELSLAEDSVLERLNSVLEPGRSITLPEKGGAGGKSSRRIQTFDSRHDEPGRRFW